MRRSFWKPGKRLSWLMLPLLWSACDNDDNLTPGETKARTEIAARDNSGILAVTQEVLDLTSIALLEKGVSGGRKTTEGRTGAGAACYPTISASYDVKKTADSLVYDGTLTIDFEDGSSCQDSVSVRKGKITDKFRYVIAYLDSIPFKAVEKITFDGFEKDSMKVDGTFTSTFTSDGSRTVDIDNAVITYPDGTSAAWSGLLVYRYDDGGTPFNPVDDTRALSGNLDGVTREGLNFNSSISGEVLFSNRCGNESHIPVSGIVGISTSGTTATVDYGDGTCDGTYTITANGETTAYDFASQSL